MLPTTTANLNLKSCWSCIFLHLPRRQGSALQYFLIAPRCTHRVVTEHQQDRSVEPMNSLTFTTRFEAVAAPPSPNASMRRLLGGEPYLCRARRVTPHYPSSSPLAQALCLCSPGVFSSDGRAGRPADTKTNRAPRARL